MNQVENKESWPRNIVITFSSLSKDLPSITIKGGWSMARLFKEKKDWESSLKAINLFWKR